MSTAPDTLASNELAPNELEFLKKLFAPIAGRILFLRLEDVDEGKMKELFSLLLHAVEVYKIDLKGAPINCGLDECLFKEWLRGEHLPNKEKMRHAIKSWLFPEVMRRVLAT